MTSFSCIRNLSFIYVCIYIDIGEIYECKYSYSRITRATESIRAIYKCWDDMFLYSAITSS